MTTTMTTHAAASDLSINDVDMLFFFPETFNNYVFDVHMEEDDDDEEEEEYSFLTRGVLQHRTLTIHDTTDVSEMSVDYWDYERMDDTLRPIARSRLTVFDPRICIIHMASVMSIHIANNGVVEFQHPEQVLEFCAALTEYDSSWIFHIRPNGTSMAIVVTSNMVEETLRYVIHQQQAGVETEMRGR